LGLIFSISCSPVFFFLVSAPVPLLIFFFSFFFFACSSGEETWRSWIECEGGDDLVVMDMVVIGLLRQR
jgi:hypothetical protein